MLTTGKPGRDIASLLTSPETIAYRVLMAAEHRQNMESAPILDAIDVLREQSAAANRGDLSRAESMLMAQATALQSIFARLVERGMSGLTLPTFEINMRMALRAQNQCRATLETLSAIKNPPIVYARQANVTTGPQQINNGAAALTRAREIENVQSQLSGEAHELLPDTRASGNASRVNPALETVGEIDRAEVRRR